MLLRYGVENHLSICDYQEISCSATALKEETGHLLYMKGRGAAVKSFVPIVALYGANAAGKSNMIHGLQTLVSAINESYNRRDSDTFPHSPCLADETAENRPSKFDCDVLIGGIRYHYGFTVNASGYQKEWLYSYPSGLRKTLLERDFAKQSEKIVVFGASVVRLTDLHIEAAHNKKFLYLSASQSFKHDSFTPVFEFFADFLKNIISPEINNIEKIAKDLEDPEVKKLVESFLSKADINIIGLEIFERESTDLELTLQKRLGAVISDFITLPIPTQIFPKTKKEIRYIHRRHDGSTFLIDSRKESTGTKHLLSLLAPILSALAKGQTVVIDEITTTLHTKLSEELLKLFASPITNSAGAQFIFSTHDTNLLSCAAIRRDEIWFAEKTTEGKTCIYPLSDFQTRKSDNLEKGYLQGRFGAVPSFGEFLSLFKKEF